MFHYVRQHNHASFFIRAFCHPTRFLSSCCFLFWKRGKGVVKLRNRKFKDKKRGSFLFIPKISIRYVIRRILFSMLMMFRITEEKNKLKTILNCGRIRRFGFIIDEIKTCRHMSECFIFVSLCLLICFLFCRLRCFFFTRFCFLSFDA